MAEEIHSFIDDDTKLVVTLRGLDRNALCNVIALLIVLLIGGTANDLSKCPLWAEHCLETLLVGIVFFCTLGAAFLWCAADYVISATETQFCDYLKIGPLKAFTRRLDAAHIKTIRLESREFRRKGGIVVSRFNPVLYHENGTLRTRCHFRREELAQGYQLAEALRARLHVHGDSQG